MKLGVSVERAYYGPAGEVPGVPYLISTNLNEKNVTQFFEAAKAGMEAEWKNFAPDSPGPPLVQLWLYLNE